MSDNPLTLDSAQIREALPHRYPFLLIDRVTACIPGESIVAYKNVSHNEPFFQGHFPNRPVMPGVLIIEAMAQAGGILSHVTMTDVHPKPLFFLASVNNTRFRQTVVPGDQMLLEVKVDNIRRGMWFYNAVAKVDGKIAVSADIVCAPGGER